MPALDRRITVRVTTQTVNDFGESVESVENIPAWARLIQDGVSRNVEVGGVYATADRVWRVRYDQRFVDAHATEGASLHVLTGTDPEVVNVTGIGEPTGRGDQESRRRRFLDLLS